MRRVYQKISQLENKLQGKQARLIELTDAYQDAIHRGNARSQASFKGKITRCEADIISLRQRINRIQAAQAADTK